MQLFSHGLGVGPNGPVKLLAQDVGVAGVAGVPAGLGEQVNQHVEQRRLKVCIGLVSVLVGIGTWLAMIAVGIGAEIMPFIGSGSYPYATAWMLLSTLVGLAAVPLAWWLVRRAVLLTREMHEARCT